MKRLLGLFFWFCAATVIAQLCILGLSFFRGNLTNKAMVQIIALLNGIDIPGERIKNAISAGQDVPVPTRDEILTAKIESNLAYKSREESLKRWHGQLQAEQARQELEGVKLAQLRKEHEALVAQFNSGRLSQTLKDVQEVLEIIAPEQAKAQILNMIKDGAMADVVAIIKGMAEDKRKKILTEFTEGDDSVKLSEILKELRVVDPKPVSNRVGESASNGSET
jgi:hypothetical protein